MYQSVSGILDEKSEKSPMHYASQVSRCWGTYTYVPQILHSGFVNSSDMYEEKVLQREASGWTSITTFVFHHWQLDEFVIWWSDEGKTRQVQWWTISNVQIVDHFRNNFIPVSNFRNFHKKTQEFLQQEGPTIILKRPCVR